MYRVALVICPPRGPLIHELAELPLTGDFVPPEHTLGWTLIPAGEPVGASNDVPDESNALWQHIAIIAAARRAGRVTTPRVLRAIQQMFVPRTRWPVGVRMLSPADTVVASGRLRTTLPHGAVLGAQMAHGDRGPIGIGTTVTAALYSLFYASRVACAEDGRTNTGLILRTLVEYPTPNQVFSLETGTP